MTQQTTEVKGTQTQRKYSKRQKTAVAARCCKDIEHITVAYCHELVKDAIQQPGTSTNTFRAYKRQVFQNSFNTILPSRHNSLPAPDLSVPVRLSGIYIWWPVNNPTVLNPDSCRKPTQGSILDQRLVTTQGSILDQRLVTTQGSILDQRLVTITNTFYYPRSHSSVTFLD